MAGEIPKNDSSAPVSSDRLWAEQLAAGMALALALLIFMAVFHPKLLSLGSKVLTTNDMAAYGWAAALGVVMQLIVHEAGTLVVAWWLGLPLRFRFFPLGAHATAILQNQPRQVWRDAVVGFAGPATGAIVSLTLAAIYEFTKDSDNPHSIAPYFLGMACVGYFYNLFTLIPILDLEGGWIAPALAPPAWLAGLIVCVWELTTDFNLVLLGVFSLGLPRFVLLLLTRMPRTDTACTSRQQWIAGIGYFVLVAGLAWLASSTFETLTVLIPETMGD
jgi:hypothetical protein